MNAFARTVLFALLLGAILPALADEQSMNAQLHEIQQQWAHIKYQLPEKEQEDAYKALEQQAEALGKEYPRRAEPKIWHAIVLSTHAGVHGGFGALSMVKQARDLLLSAESIDPQALQGSVYTSLGSLYYQVPGWPLGFGDKDKAEEYLKKALALNPDGIDPNYFYGDLLHRRGDDRQALAVLDKALHAPARADRPLADQGRRHEVQALIAKIRADS